MASTFPVSVAALLFAYATAGFAQTKPAAPKAASKVPAAASAAAEKARETYNAVCAICHGATGKGLTPEQDFTDSKWKHGSTTAAVTKTIREGVKGTTMLGFKDKYSDAEILELAKLVKSFSVPPKKR